MRLERFATGCFLLVVLFTACADFFAIEMYFTDSVTEMDYARLVWQEKSLFPRGWQFTTETYPFFPALTAALLFGASGAFVGSFAAAIIISALFLSFLIYKYLKSLSVDRSAALFSLCLFWCLYPNWMIMFDMVAYFYVEFCAVMMLTLWGIARPGRALSFLSFAAAFIAGFHSLRVAALLYIPLLFAAVIFAFFAGNEEERLFYRARSVYAAKILAVNIFGHMVMKNVLMELFDIRFAMTGIPKFTDDLAASALASLRGLGDCLGVLPETPTLYWALSGAEFTIEPYFYIPLLLALAIFLVRALRGGELSDERKFTLAFFALSSLAAFGAAALLNLTASRYFFPAVLFVMFSIAFLLDKLIRRGAALAAAVFVSAAAVFGLFHMQYAFISDARREGLDLKAAAPLADFLEERGIYRAYATYWAAGPIEVFSDGRIVTGYFDGELRPYLWGTRRQLYERGEYNAPVAVVLNAEELSALPEKRRALLNRGKYLGEVGKYRVFRFEENPILLEERTS